MIETLTTAGVLQEAQEMAQSLIKEARGIFNSPQYAGAFTSEEGLLNSLINLIS
jgi:hypothetical protein